VWQLRADAGAWARQKPTTAMAPLAAAPPARPVASARPRKTPARAPAQRRHPLRAATPDAASAAHAADFARQDADLKGAVDALRADATARFEASLARAAAAAAAAPAASASPTGAPPAARARFAASLDALAHGLVERGVEARLLLLAALAGEHVLFVGPPGTAKSELARRLAGLVDGGPYFERLLTRFSVPEELFGPLSMRALEDDRYVRQTEGYLPAARVAFIDEVFKVGEGC